MRKITFTITEGQLDKIVQCLVAQEETALAKYLELQVTEARLKNRLKVVELEKQKQLKQMQLETAYGKAKPVKNSMVQASNDLLRQ